MNAAMLSHRRGRDDVRAVWVILAAPRRRMTRAQDLWIGTCTTGVTLARAEEEGKVSAMAHEGQARATPAI